MNRALSQMSILNILLIAIAIVLSQDLYFEVYKKDIKVSIASETANDEAEESTDGDDESMVNVIPSLIEYTAIIDKNLFHPDRIIPPEKKAIQEVPKPDLVLYGTLITDDLKIAFLEDSKSPSSTPGRGKRQRAFKKGDVYSGFTIKEIEADRVIMARGEENMTVYLSDPNKKKSRAVVTTGIPTTSQTAGLAQSSQTHSSPRTTMTPAPPPQAKAQEQRPPQASTPPAYPEGTNPLLEMMMKR